MLEIQFPASSFFGSMSKMPWSTQAAGKVRCLQSPSNAQGTLLNNPLHLPDCFDVFQATQSISSQLRLRSKPVDRVVMAELAAAPAYAPRSLYIWQTLLNWLAFLLQIVLQIAPSVSQLLSFIGFRQTFLSSASSISFDPLPVQLPVPDTPPRLISNDQIEKLTIVLDLDETLVCAYETSSLPATIHEQATEAGLTWFELECASGDMEGDGKQKTNHVTVFERPGLHQFLQETSEFANLVLFTAGLEGYASPLVDRIDLKNRFSLRLYRPSTISTKYREHVKDLSCISKDLCRTVIVDNNPFSFLLQPLNGIPCLPFSAAQPHDEQLVEVVLPLLKCLSLQRDVRPVLYEKFHMPEWFLKQGIPATDWIL